MPYVAPIYRKLLLGRQLAMMNPGDLNYVITSALNEYVGVHKLSYHTINDCLGALEGAKLEFYRRVAASYEDKKLAENGDVYTIWEKKNET